MRKAQANTVRPMLRTLFCDCGSGPAAAPGGLCRRCYCRRAHSRARFGGNRELALARDGHACQVCGARDQKTVHHRQPGNHDLAWLLTVCPGCHARIHRFARLRRFVEPPLPPLWSEQHPGAPLQFQFDFERGHV